MSDTYIIAELCGMWYPFTGVALTNLITLLHNIVSHEFAMEERPFCEFSTSAIGLHPASVFATNGAKGLQIRQPVRPNEARRR